MDSPTRNRGIFSFSKITTRRPAFARRVPAELPAGPPPMIATSNASFIASEDNNGYSRSHLTVSLDEFSLSCIQKWFHLRDYLREHLEIDLLLSVAQCFRR